MKTILKLLPMVLCMICSACKKDSGMATQRILGPSDLIYNGSTWSWNNGIATVEEYDGSFSFKSEVNGDLSFSYKINDDYLGLISIKVGNKHYFSDDEEGPTKWTKVNCGNVKYGDLIMVVGRECSIKDIAITGTLADNSQNESDQEHHEWDF